jgi:hypothetical protein
MMKKTINSEQKYSNSTFKVKVGTTNKKNPETIYIELGTYVKPLEGMESFSDYFINFDKKTKYFINSLNKNKNICEKDFILITDVADERINKGKKSYLDLQIFLKPKKKEIFKNIADNIYNDYITDIILYIKNELKENNIECYKTKK